MGTNYYLHKDFCPCCGKPKKEIHIGKSSIGLRFLFYKSSEIYDYESFIKAIKTGVIYDEYGNVISSDEMVKIVKLKQDEETHSKYGDKCIEGYDFSESEFC